MAKGLPVKGYTDQPDAKINLVNRNKEVEERILRVLDPMYDSSAFDRRWLSIARTHFEQGFMALNRAVFQPQRVALPEDKKE